MYPTTLGNSVVTFNGTPTPLTFVSGTQINAIVPYELSGQTTARIVVTHHGQRSAEFVLPLQETAPGLVGNPVTVNSAANPVERGGAIVLFATGSGLWNQDVRAGQVPFAPQASPAVLPKAEVTVRIAGTPARVLYAGAAPNTAGVLQVNALVPDDVGSGTQVVELTIGPNSNAPQTVTVAIR